MNNSRDLIMALDVNYGQEELDPFIKSLKKSGFIGTFVLFHGQNRSDALPYLYSYGVEVRLFDYTKFGKIPPNALRYMLYLPFLKNSADKYDRVFIADVRDILFQQNPFDFEFSPGLHVFAEDCRKTILSCDANSVWVVLKFGGDELAKIGHKPIICSGTTYGTTAAMVSYLELMNQYILPPNELIGYDQGIHNWLIWNDKIGSIVIHSNETGHITTLGQMADEDIILDNEGYVCNTLGERSHIVHQYDRKPAISEALLKLCT